MGKDRYVFQGKLITETGLHVGSGRGDIRTDATVVKDVYERPFIPGSALKGVLRSAVEGLAAPLDFLRSCQLDPDSGVACPTVDVEWQEEYVGMQERGAWEKELWDFIFDGRVKTAKGVRRVALCDTCRLFGSPFLASKVMVKDLPLAHQVTTEIRHGVGIDRETETAREGVKFDYEAVPPQAEFTFELTLDSPTEVDLGLLAAGLREMQLGMVPLGGNTSRGIGRCRLLLERILRINREDAKTLLRYLLESEPAGEGEPRRIMGEEEWEGEEVEQFIKDQIRCLLERGKEK